MPEKEKSIADDLWKNFKIDYYDYFEKFPDKKKSDDYDKYIFFMYGVLYAERTNALKRRKNEPQ